MMTIFKVYFCMLIHQVAESWNPHKFATNFTNSKERNIPFYVSMGSMAASGGYYISAPADKIFASKETLTGSLGVIMQGYDYSELMKN